MIEEGVETCNRVWSLSTGESWKGDEIQVEHRGRINEDGACGCV